MTAPAEVEYIEITWTQNGEQQKTICHPDWYTIICFRDMTPEERERWQIASAKALVQIRADMGWEITP